MPTPRARIILLAVVLTASLGVGVPAPEAGIGSGDLVFASLRGGAFEIFRVPADGASAPVNLTRTALRNLDPAWSPDGSRIAFVRARDGRRSVHLFSMDVEGRNLRRLTSGPHADRQPAWSPDGSRIAFVRSAPPLGTSRVFTVRADGTNLRRLTDTRPGVVNTAPSWSPDGTRIVFSSDRSGTPQLHTVDADGTDVRRLVVSGRMDVNPAWSPDGTRIAFERCCRQDVSEILVVGTDGTAPTNITRSDVHEAEPAWSPDGTRIAFVRVPAGGGERSIWTMTAEGEDRRRLTSGAHADLSPDWGEASGMGSAAAGGLHGARAVRSGVVRSVAAAGGPGRITQRVRRVAPGVRLIRRVHRRGPKRVFALEVDLRKRPTLDVGLGRRRVPGAERTRRIARRHRAMAAVNGDFALPGGRPAHAFARNGDLKQSSFHSGPSFAVARGGRRAFVAPPTVSISVREPSGDRWPLGRWNFGTPVHAEPGIYSPAAGKLEPTPAGACAARLAPAGPRRWAPGEQGVERDYIVGRAGCFRRPLPRNGKIVVAARPGSPEALLIRSLVPGSLVSLGWSLGFHRTLDSLGGYPMLVRGGRVAVGSCRESLCRRHPRTAVAVRRNGRILLVVVDGRRRGWSVGMTLVDLARELRRMGARRAVNLDGGGSSTMVLRGKLVNRPAGGRERPVSSALLVLRGRDRGEREPVPPLQGARAGAAVGGAPEGDRWLRDPGSTGGLLEALAEGAFGPPQRLPRGLREALRAFRAA